MFNRNEGMCIITIFEHIDTLCIMAIMLTLCFLHLSICFYQFCISRKTKRLKKLDNRKDNDLKIAIEKTKQYLEDCKTLKLDNNFFDLTQEMHHQVILNELLAEHFNDLESIYLKASNIQLKECLSTLEKNVIKAMEYT